MANDLVRSITSSAKLDRDKGVNLLEEYLNNCSIGDIQDIENNLLNCFTGTQSWEIVHGGLLGAKCLITRSLASQEFKETIISHLSILLEHEEFRVRISAGEVLGVLCQVQGIVVYHRYKQLILESVQANLERDMGTTSSDNINDARADVRDAAQIFHDSAGWKSLETWMKCLQCVIEGCGHLFNPCIDQTLLDLIFCALSNTNRFVRETGYCVCAALVSCGMNQQDSIAMEIEVNAIYQLGGQFAEYMAKGLSDNWSMVRLAASVATRKFFMSLPSESAREEYYPSLIPRMCLNRYYVAEGVRNYSQETWVYISQGRGKELVEKYIDDVVEHYIRESEADNHAVREAACSCIAELGYKINSDALRGHILTLMDALLVCFKDDSWPVRDSACIACGNFVKCFPEEARSKLDVLYPLFFANLQDNIASVRQGASKAIANVVHAYGRESAELVLLKVREGLAGVEQQATDNGAHTHMEAGPGAFGVIKRLRDNDPSLHTGQQMYSCGSLAPKMGRGSPGGGCMDHQFKKPSQPWELTDGCMNLIAELSSVAELDNQITQLMPLVIKAVSFRHYMHHIVLLNTLCSRLLDIARGIGKRNFKMYLEDLFEPLFYGLNCDNDLTSSAAGHCIKDIADYIGPSILRGRVEQYNPTLLSQLDIGLSSIRL